MKRCHCRILLCTTLTCCCSRVWAQGPEFLSQTPSEPANPNQVAPPAAKAASAGNAADSEESLQPPRIVFSPPPEFPPGEASRSEHPTVVVHALIDAAGSLAEVHVDESAGAAFDQAALLALQRWRFEPAKRGDTPVGSRVRIAVHFELPEFDLAHPTVAAIAQVRPQDSPEEARAASPPAAASPAAAQATPDDFFASAEVEDATRGPADLVLDRQVIDAAPRAEAADILKSAPGVFIARPEGDAVAHRIMLRGFDAEHGQDLELLLDHMPINQPSHIHGQGYADLGFLIPEVIDSVRVTEGVYDPRQGDFAVAGSIRLRLGVQQRGLQAKSSYGSFGTFRQLLLWAPEDEAKETFAAVQFRRSDGFGANRGGRSASGMGQFAFRLGSWQGKLHAGLYGARYGLVGALRKDDIDSGSVGFHGVYAQPTALGQAAFAAQGHLAADFEKRQRDGRRSLWGTWFIYRDFRTQTNFTGYTQTSRFNPEWTGRGDLVEQLQTSTSWGMHASHRSRNFILQRWLRSRLELGLAGRLDRIAQQQNLLAAPQNETWDQRIDAAITGADLGAFADIDWQFASILRLRTGLRVDALYYDIDDELGNFIPRFRRESYIPGFRRSAFGLAVGPRFSAEVMPWRRVSMLAAYGEGYRSPQARLLEDGETAPYTKVRSADIGLRWRLGRKDELTLTGSAYLTKLSDDIVFEAEENSFSSIGPSTRRGFVAYAVAKPWSWLFAMLSLTYVHATADEPPSATAEDPTPPYTPGALIPYVPPWVARLDWQVRQPLFEIGNDTVVGRLGSGYSFLSPRPLPFSESAAAVHLLEATAGLHWRFLDLSIDAFNLLDRRYAASEYTFVSNWEPNATPSRVPARHIAAGAPLTLMANLTVTL